VGRGHFDAPKVRGSVCADLEAEGKRGAYERQRERERERERQSLHGGRGEVNIEQPGMEWDQPRPSPCPATDAGVYRHAQDSHP
jgi:hypothetical protein